jgi:uncharacterized cupredoxin-like copper-binding protein
MNAAVSASVSLWMPSHAQPRHRVNGVVLGILLLAHTGVSLALAQSDASDQTVVTVDIHRRKFQPDRLVLPQGRRTVLILKNHDSELHAFVPSELFAGESLNVSGNGAPEFGSHGLIRVIIPSEGVAEIRFVPTRPGEYRYRCDMPGHEMGGLIVVE